MKISQYSKNRLLRYANDWEVDADFLTPIYNYLIHGYHPGSFFAAVLANNFADAISRSHSLNTIPALKGLMNWIRALNGYGVFWGFEEVVNEWLKLTDEQRREKLETLNAIYTEEEEMVLILKDEPTKMPYRYWHHEFG